MTSLHTAATFGGGSTPFPGTGTAMASGTSTAYPGTGTAYPGTGTAYPGMGTAMPGQGALNLGEIGHARKTMMGVKLDQASDSVTGQTVVDSKAYEHDLNSLTPKNLGNLGDIKKGRMLLKSVRQTNPKHAPAWIASATLEAITGRLQAARNIIMKGTEVNADSEDIWLEAIKLMPVNNQKSVAAQGVAACPLSVKLWLRACDLETDKKSKRAVLRKALLSVPGAVRIWKAAVDLEELEDAKILLGRAVECCKTSVELWLALAHLSPYAEAQKVLNRARKAVPTDRTIWITAARLEETAGKQHNVEKLIQTGVKSLRNNGVEINREEWIKEAERAETTENIATAQAIIRTILGEGVETDDRKSQWMEDAEASISHRALGCARAIYAHALTAFPSDEDIWLEAAVYEKGHGTSESLDNHLAKAVKYCPRAEILWLMAAKSQWTEGNVDGARQILAHAFTANKNSEQIWLAAIKLESENDEFDRAASLLKNARQEAGGARVWIKSVHLEWVQGKLDDARELLGQAVEQEGDEPKLWMMRGQIEQQGGNLDGAREIFGRGRKKCPNSVPLWILSARLEMAAKNYTRARSILERGRTINENCDELWLEAVRVEQACTSNTSSTSKNIMAKALQDCPASGRLWAHAIFMEDKPARRTKSVDALKKCENDPKVLLAVARLFLSEGKNKKARSWFMRTVKLDPDYGDAWAAYYKFELQHGDEDRQAKLIKHCANADPRHGELWQSFTKNVEHWKKPTAEMLAMAAKATVDLR